MNVNNKFKKLTLPLMIASSAQLYTIPASAEKKLEEVVVTARKREETLMEAPLSVVATTGKQLDDQGISNIAQLGGQVPGVHIGNEPQNTNIFIRGIGTSGNRGFEQSVGVYVDGVYQVRSHQFAVTMVDVGEMEILKGPQGILFGKNSVAGAVKVETASPNVGEEFNGSIALDYAPEQDTQQATLLVSGSITDTLAARAVVRTQESDGYVDNKVLKDDYPDTDDDVFRGTLSWQPTDSFTATAKYTEVNMEFAGAPLVMPIVDSTYVDTLGQPGNSLTTLQVLGTIAALATPGFKASTGSDTYSSWEANNSYYPGKPITGKTDYSQASLKLDWDLENYAVTALTGYVDYKDGRHNDVDFGPGNVVHAIESEKLELKSQEIRISSDFDGFFNFISGFYYEKQDGYISADIWIDGTLGGLLSPGLFAPVDSIYRLENNKVENETRAVFLEGSFELSETFSLEVGARYSEETKRNHKSVDLGVGAPASTSVYWLGDGTLTAAGLADPVGAAVTRGAWGGGLNSYLHNLHLERNEYHFDPSAKLLWNATGDTLVYLSYSEGFKAGGFNASGDTANPDGTPGPGTEFEDENVKSWELGVKTRLFDGRAQVSGAIFNTIIENLQVTAFDGVSFVVTNAAESENKGVDLEGRLAVTDNLTLGAAVTYLDSEYTSYPAASCTVAQSAATPVGSICSQDLSGMPGQFAPEWTGDINATYKMEIGSTMYLTVIANASYSDDYYTSPSLDRLGLQDSFWKINARIALSSIEEVWEVAVYGRNLTDEVTYSSTKDTPLSAGLVTKQIEEPRVLGLQAIYKF